MQESEQLFNSGKSLYQQGKLGESLTHGESGNDYIAAAKHLASDSNKLAALTANLRSTMSRSTLMNAQTFTNNLESVYRTMRV